MNGYLHIEFYINEISEIIKYMFLTLVHGTLIYIKILYCNLNIIYNGRLI